MLKGLMTSYIVIQIDVLLFTIFLNRRCIYTYIYIYIYTLKFKSKLKKYCCVASQVGKISNLDSLSNLPKLNNVLPPSAAFKVSTKVSKVSFAKIGNNQSNFINNNDKE